MQHGTNQKLRLLTERQWATGGGRREGKESKTNGKKEMLVEPTATICKPGASYCFVLFVQALRTKYVPVIV